VSQLGNKLQFDNNGIATCPESGQLYKFENGHIQLIKVEA
jgi:hypothetical protein